MSEVFRTQDNEHELICAPEVSHDAVAYDAAIAAGDLTDEREALQNSSIKLKTYLELSSDWPTYQGRLIAGPKLAPFSGGLERSRDWGREIQAAYDDSGLSFAGNTERAIAYLRQLDIGIYAALAAQNTSGEIMESPDIKLVPHTNAAPGAVISIVENTIAVNGPELATYSLIGQNTDLTVCNRYDEIVFSGKPEDYFYLLGVGAAVEAFKSHQEDSNFGRSPDWTLAEYDASDGNFEVLELQLERANLSWMPEETKKVLLSRLSDARKLRLMKTIGTARRVDINFSSEYF